MYTWFRGWYIWLIEDVARAKTKTKASRGLHHMTWFCLQSVKMPTILGPSHNINIPRS